MKDKVVEWLKNYFWELLYINPSKVEVYEELVHYMEGMDGMLFITYKDLPTDEIFETRDILAQYITKYATKAKEKRLKSFQ